MVLENGASRLAGAVGLLLATTSLAMASGVELKGSASGTFSVTGTSTYQDLTYTGSTFDTTSAAGSYSLDGAAATPNVDNLGSLTLVDPAGVQTYSGKLNLNVAFTLPGTASGTFVGNISGILSIIAGQATSTVKVDFSTTPTQTYTFPHGTWTLQLNSASLIFAKGARTVTVPITGQGTVVTTVASPVSGVVFLLGAVANRRRRITS